MLRTPEPTRARSADDLLDAGLVARLSRVDFTSRKVFAGKLRGERRSKKRGQSVEFADHRSYVAGDDLRRIDWNILGRLDRLFLKLFLEEEDLSLHLVLDASASSDCGEPGKFLFMQRLAMALGYVGLVNYNRVAATVLGGREPGGREAGAGPAQPEPPGAPVMRHARDLRGRRRVHDLARFLCSVEPSGGAAFGACCKRLALARRGRGVMVVLSDFFLKEGYQDGLRLLAGRGYDVFAVQVLSPQELEPELGGDLRLKDIEDGDAAEVTVSAPLLRRYRQNLSAYNAELRLFCARREIGLVSVRSDTPVDALVLGGLRRGGLIG